MDFVFWCCAGASIWWVAGREFWGRDLGMAWGCLGGCDDYSEGV